MNRFLWAAGGDQRRLRLAALCQFTLAGPPVIYYGTEVGLSQERDVRQGTRGIPEESRLPMLWGQAQDAALLDWYTRLLRLRKEHPALTSPQRQTLWLAAHPHPQALAYRRGAGEQAVIVVMNLSAQPCQVELPSEAGRMIFATGPDVQMAAPGKLALPGLGGAALGAG
jgi:glycosidase